MPSGPRHRCSGVCGGPSVHGSVAQHEFLSEAEDLPGAWRVVGCAVAVQGSRRKRRGCVDGFRVEALVDGIQAIGAGHDH
jgi:hypothetical protein